MLVTIALFAIAGLLLLILLVVAGAAVRIMNLHEGLDLLADVIYLQTPRKVMHQVFDPEAVLMLIGPYVKRSNDWPAPTGWPTPMAAPVTRSLAWPPPIPA